jgi:hypothetical protein
MPADRHSARAISANSRATAGSAVAAMPSEPGHSENIPVASLIPNCWSGLT